MTVASDTGKSPFDSMRAALKIIHGEHASLASVLGTVGRYVPHLRDHRMKPDCEVFGSIISYIGTFADQFHHPKEDEHLFRALRSRTTEADAILLELQHEHATSQAELRDLKRALHRTRGGRTSEIEEFAYLLERYVKGQQDHIRKEDEVVIPMAQRALAESDWEPIALAFRANRDPFFCVGTNGPIGSFMARAVIHAAN